MLLLHKNCIIRKAKMLLLSFDLMPMVASFCNPISVYIYICTYFFTKSLVTCNLQLIYHIKY